MLALNASMLTIISLRSRRIDETGHSTKTQRQGDDHSDDLHIPVHSTVTTDESVSLTGTMTMCDDEGAERDVCSPTISSILSSAKRSGVRPLPDVLV